MVFRQAQRAISHFAVTGIIFGSFFLSGCNAVGSGVPSATTNLASLASATNTTCVNPSATAQSVTLPDTGGVKASLQFAQFEAGSTTCQNITVATGNDVSSATPAPASSASASSESQRQIASVQASPLISITLGQAFTNNTHLTLTTVLSGATISTDSNTVFPDGTYEATITVVEFGTPVSYSLVFTATNGQLSVTSGPLPLTLGQGAVINIYNRGVTPPDFDLTLPSPTPTINPSATPTAVPTATPASTTAPTSTPIPSPTPTIAPTTAPSGSPVLATQPVANETIIGSFNAVASGPNYGQPFPNTTFSGTIAYTNLAESQNCIPASQIAYPPYTCVAQGPVFLAGEFGGNRANTTTYSITGLPAVSYRVEFCNGNVGYSGSGTSGTMSYNVPLTQLTFSDACDVVLFSQPASVVNSAPNHGYGYAIYYIDGPVTSTTAITASNPPAVDLQ